MILTSITLSLMVSLAKFSTVFKLRKSATDVFAQKMFSIDIFNFAQKKFSKDIFNFEICYRYD